MRQLWTVRPVSDGNVRSSVRADTWAHAASSRIVRSSDTDSLLALGGSPVFAPSTVDRETWLATDVVEDIDTPWESESGAEVSAEADREP